jgi:hypothetical protein
MMEKIRTQFKDAYKKYNIDKAFPQIPVKEKYTSIEVLKYIKKIKGDTTIDNSEKLGKIKEYLTNKAIMFNKIINKFKKILIKATKIYNFNLTYNPI